MRHPALSPEAERLIAEVSAAASDSDALAIIAAFNFGRLPEEEREILIERVIDARREPSS